MTLGLASATAVDGLAAVPLLNLPPPHVEHELASVVVLHHLLVILRLVPVS